MAVGGSVTIRAECHGRLGPRWSPLKVDFDVSTGISVSASATVAIAGGGSAADGTVTGAISVCGRQLSADFHLQYNEDLIKDTSTRLQDLLPQLPSLPPSVLIPVKPPQLRPLSTSADWIFDVRRFPGKNDNVVELRVLPSVTRGKSTATPGPTRPLPEHTPKQPVPVRGTSACGRSDGRWTSAIPRIPG